MGSSTRSRAKGTSRSGAPAADSRAAKQILAELKASGVTRVKVGGFDIDGVLRGKYISLDKLASALKSGFGFCDVIFGWDIGDALYDNSEVTGWDSGYPDAHAVLDTATLRHIPWEPGVASLLCDFKTQAGQDHPACPRSLLKRIDARSRALGWVPKFGAEFEFFMFRETRDSLARKSYSKLRPLDPGMFGYSWVRTGQDAQLMDDIWRSCEAYGIRLEGLHTETGPGVYEAAITYDDVVSAADQAALFKTTLKQLAHRHGLSVTFMAKCDATMPGASGHLHQSLVGSSGNIFYDQGAEHGMSQLMKQYVGGQLALMSEWTALYAPTVNSYKRFVPGLWAPIVPSWGVENRTCAIRVVAPNSPTSLRVEYRQPGADINPYISMASCLAAGLWGIEQACTLPEPIRGEARAQGDNHLPSSLRAATNLLRNSESARSALGSEFVEHYVRTRDWEARQYEVAVTDWELRRYFETV